jgi:hypothetical protein
MWNEDIRCKILYSIAEKKYVMPVGNWARYSTLQVAGKGKLLLLYIGTAIVKAGQSNWL